MPVLLTPHDIDTALPRVSPGLEKYLCLQRHRDTCDVRHDAEYRRRFNGFYRVRHGHVWQDSFYALLERTKGQRVSLSEVLHALHDATGRWEASFASKLVATVDPEMPVIDSVVLKNLRLRLPPSTSNARAARIEELHSTLRTTLQEFLTTPHGIYLVQRFRTEYPHADITPMKMLDLVLWQTRPGRQGG